MRFSAPTALHLISLAVDCNSVRCALEQQSAPLLFQMLLPCQVVWLLCTVSLLLSRQRSHSQQWQCKH